ncbi:MAG TPA: hypothetical protein VFT43_08130 [Candidatus Polarisedimenticolia bacterium]|nr:hypothetical protein [Candidatus Polarisedimenticolia bacterium]
MLRRILRFLFTRGGEALLAVALVLVFFFSFMALLSLTFPEGTSLTDLMRSGQPVRGRARPAVRQVDVGQPDDLSSGAVALLSSVHREVKDKPPDAIAWSDSRSGLPLGDYHSVQTFELSRATITFSEDAEMKLGENSLVVVRRLESLSSGSRKRASLLVLDGTLQGHLAVGRLEGPIVEIEAATDAARLRADSSSGKATQFAVSVNDNRSSTFSVFGGSAQVVSDRGTLVVAPNQSVTVSAEGTFGPVLPLPPAPAPVAPQDGARQLYRSSRTRVEFRWSAPAPEEGYVLTVARDRGFLDQVASESAGGPVFTLGNLRAGRYYWRVRAVRAGLEGPESATREFVIVQDRRPPPLAVTFPGHSVAQQEILLRGTTSPGTKVSAAGQEATADGNGRITFRLGLKRGVNVVVVEAADEIGNVTYRSSIVNANY